MGGDVGDVHQLPSQVLLELWGELLPRFGLPQGDQKVVELSRLLQGQLQSDPGALFPSVGGKYDLETGTSIAAAFVSGVAALVAQRDPAIDSGALLKLLLRTSRPLAAGGAGIGLVDARRAVEEREKAGVGR